MVRHRTTGQPSTRRSLFQTGFAATAAALASPKWLVAAEEDQGRLQTYDKVQAETFPWGWIRWLMNGKIDPHAEMTLGLVYLEPDQTNPLHIHPNSAEYLHVLSGSCEHRVGRRWATLKPGDTLRIPKGVPHQARTHDQSCRSLIVYDTPARIMIPVTEGTSSHPRRGG
jgi:quercetin dioxygenase-like cupin family protein